MATFAIFWMRAVPVGLVAVRSPEVLTYSSSPSLKDEVLMPLNVPVRTTTPVELLAMASFVIPKAGMVEAEVLAAKAMVVSLPEAPEI